MKPETQWSRYHVESESGGFHVHCHDCAYLTRNDAEISFSYWCEELTRIVELITKHEQSVHAEKEQE
jgi:hypothetical protein